MSALDFVNIGPTYCQLSVTRQTNEKKKKEKRKKMK